MPLQVRKSCWHHQQDCKAVTVHRTTAPVSPSAAMAAPAPLKAEANEAKAEANKAKAEAKAVEDYAPVNGTCAMAAQAIIVFNNDDGPEEKTFFSNTWPSHWIKTEC